MMTMVRMMMMMQLMLLMMMRMMGGQSFRISHSDYRDCGSDSPDSGPPP